MASPRRLITRVAVAASALAMVAGLMYAVYATDRAKARLAQVSEASARCAKLRPAMSREEVIQIMGPPLKQYDVRPEGKEGEVAFRELIFALPGSRQPAYVDFDPESLRAVEVSCGPGFHLVLPPSEVLKVRAAAASVVRDK
jgi:hypothetical protein